MKIKFSIERYVLSRALGFSVLFWFIFLISMGRAEKKESGITVALIGNEQIFDNEFPEVLKYFLKNSPEGEVIQEIKWIGYGRFNLHKLWFLGRSVRNQIGIVQMGYRGSSFLILQEEAESVLYDPNLTESTIERYLAACKKVRIPRNPLLWIPYLPQSKSEQQSVVNLKIIDLAKKYEMGIIPVAQAFQNAKELNPTIELFESNGINPSRLGTYLSACLLYEVLTMRSCEKLPFTFEISRLPVAIQYNIDESTAKIAQKAAHEAMRSIQILLK